MFLNLIGNSRSQHMSKRWQPIIPLKKGEVLSANEFKIAVLNSEAVKQIHRFYSDGDSKKAKLIWEQIKSILDEIAFNNNMGLMRLMFFVNEKWFAQATSGIYVNPKAILDLKDSFSAGTSAILYLPTHRSYVDGGLVSYICFRYDIAIPTIAAGMSNLIIHPHFTNTPDEL